MNEKISITVIMSTYNGAKTIKRQIDSILSQKGVDITLYVRDDGSNDNTIGILNDYARKYSNIIINLGSNIGWERSFLCALKDAPPADYYAFSDQDDLWMDDKLVSGVKMLEPLSSDIPLMYHCNKISTWENLRTMRHQIRRIPQPLNHENAMIQEYAQGCSIILNNMARNLISKYSPKKKLAHDFWCGLICYLFFFFFYDNRKHFYHISYGSNASGEGHMIKSWQSRLKKILESKEVYYSPCQDLLDGYRTRLSDDDVIFCEKVLKYKQNISDKIYLLFSPMFIRDSFLGTLSLKVSILLNKL